MSHRSIARRPSSRLPLWRAAVAATLLVVVAVGLSPAAGGPATAATGPKVVIVVGPAGSRTAANRSWANAAAKEALRHTPNVIRIFSPNATWTRVRAALTGASLVVYIGRGLGSPAPGSTALRPSVQDGFGLNPAAGRGDTSTRWYGESLIRTLRLAPNALIVLSQLAYASGASEHGTASPSLATARRRIDNYGAGFLAAGASAVIADVYQPPAYYVRALFAGDASLDTIWRTAPSSHRHETRFVSARTTGAIGRTDPDRPGSGFHRSIIGWPSTRTGAILGGAPAGPLPTPAGSSVPARTCGPSLQAKLDSAPTGATVDLSGCSYAAGATVKRSMTVRGAEIHPAPGTAGITVAADGVTLDRLTIAGPQATAYAGREYGVFVAGSSSRPVSRLTISNSTIGSLGNGGIWLQNAAAPVIAGNIVQDVVYAGIMIISGTAGVIRDNTVRRIGVNGSDAHDGNAYGIVLTDTGGSATTQFTVDGNTVADVPTWHALDTHGGHQITFSGNRISGASRGLFITTSASGSRPDTIAVTGNVFESPSSAAGRPQAVTTYESSNVSITGNTATGWGPDGFFGDYLGRSQNLTISDNIVTP